MAVTSQRSVAITFAGDFSANAGLDAAENTASPAKIDIVTLAAGANTITPPTNAKAVTILFPTGNTVDVTLKGVTGDTGIVLHNTDPTSIGIDSYAATFVLTAVTQVVGVRLIWS